ncbi:MerR family transcriptional regulator [Cohnella zeiphila]|uniref:MerR family transcriptional regulator n=1 Tax=Cohnella zeiphila TaxID=2761120 RepID=A0A7X0SPG8_9BACL|nr:MerR family transcriptional regulator [Cohnella zeiphila]MBB6733601.1 MerR family transcriptional regulator [Cohnella zeiphila]
MEYTIKDVAEQFNLAPHTLRYYETEGLLPPVHRLENGRRLYNETDLARIQMICCMRATGMSVESIKHYNDLNLRGDDTLPERRQIIEGQKEVVENHLREYQNYLELLKQKLQHYDSLIAEKQPQP